MPAAELFKDFLSADARARLPSAVAAKATEVTTTALAVTEKKDPTLIQALAGTLGDKAKNGAKGALLGAFANALGLLEDEDDVLNAYLEKEAKQLSGVRRLIADMSPKTVISSRLVGGRAGIDAIRRSQLHSLSRAVQEEMNRGEIDRAKVEKLRDEAELLLGQDGVLQIENWRRVAQQRSGGRTDEERHVAVQVVDQLESFSLDGATPEEIATRLIEERMDEELMGVGMDVVNRREYQAINSVLSEPGKHIPGATGDVTLMRSGFWEQFVAVALGVDIRPKVKGVRENLPLTKRFLHFNWGNLAGGSELTLKENGSVWLRIGVENEQIAPKIGELMVATDVEEKFQNAAEIASRKINLGKLSDTVRTIATWWGKGKLRYPGVIVVGRSGAGENDLVVTRNVNTAASSLQSAVTKGRIGQARMTKIEEGDPAVKFPEPFFKEFKIEQVKEKIFSLPRASEVVAEVTEMTQKIETRESAAYSAIGLRYPPLDAIVQQYANMSIESRAKAWVSLTTQSGKANEVAEVRASMERRARRIKGK